MTMGILLRRGLGSIQPARARLAGIAALALILALPPVSIAGMPEAGAVEPVVELAPKPKVKRKIVRQVDKCLRKRAFVHGRDFSSAAEMLEDDLPRIESSDTALSFASAINAGLKEYKVSHLRVMTPEQMAARDRGTAIGAGFKSVQMDNGHLVTLVLPESPSALAGMKKGDLVVAVDEMDLSDGRRVPGVLERGLSGEWNQKRRVEWMRGEERMSAEIGFGEFPMALPFELKWLDGDIAWITLNTFRHNVYSREWIESKFQEIADRNAGGLVLDLRSNGGGRLSHTFHLASMLLPPGSELGARIFRNATDHAEYDPDAEDPAPEAGLQSKLKRYAEDVPVYEGPLVVLTDGSAGSGGDYFPAIMQDLRDAKLIGTTTVGALLGGSWCNLARDYALMYPAQEILRPNGSRVEGVGVSPDIPLTPYETLDDATIRNVALQTLAEMAGTPAEN